MSAELLQAYQNGKRLFQGADLTDAVLTDAVLRGADLTDADLRGAVLRGAVLPKDFHILQIGPIGSRSDFTIATIYPNNIPEIRTGCFSGSLAEFVRAVQKKSADDSHREDYELLVIPLLTAWLARHSKKQSESEAET